MKTTVLCFLALGLASLAGAQSSTLHVEMAGVPSLPDFSRKMDMAARNFGRVTARLTERARTVRHHTQTYGHNVPFSLPMRVIVTHNGRDLAPALVPSLSPNVLTLAFDAPGTARAFSPGYQTQLQDAFNSALATINAVFGDPSASGTVHVRNFDFDIDDRDAVAGGFYTPNNGFGEAEIRFPVYLSPEATYVNFVHTILLAYLGSSGYDWDAFEEGLVRAATMKIARTPGALPAGLDPVQIQSVLESTYDVGPNYDWYNQRALGGPIFIAANLRSTPLPSGGGVGGLYLLRYEMAGSAWQKMLVQYPGFISELNAAVYSNPTIGQDMPSLLTACQGVLDTLAGSSGATIEGNTFAQWKRRQFILETSQTNGSKLLCEPIAITSGLAGPDFGVFIVQANYFQTAANGDETLLSGTSFPIFWDPLFFRVFPTAQENQIDIGFGYGTVTPNLPDLFAGQPYRMAVDLPVHDQMARVFLPAGAIATTAHPVSNNFYGTVENVPLQAGDTLNVVVNWLGSAISPIPVTNGAFGALITDVTFADAQSLTIEVVLTHNAAPTVLMTRFVNKGPGDLALDLRVHGEGTYQFSGGLPAGVSMIGLPVDPFTSSSPDLFNVSANQLLLARYNQTRTQYDLFPDTEAATIGHGYFIRLNASQPSFSFSGRANPNTPTAVALRPGWNMVTSPLPESIPTSAIKVVRATAFPTDYATSAGTDIGLDFFQFVPGANDVSSGVPETGSLVPATTFDPGVGYFVRVLAPEGVSMLFFPSVPSSGPYVKAATANGQTTGTDGWLMRWDLKDGKKTVSAHLGGSGSATSAFDPKEDSGMPPGIGGFQITSIGAQPLFRDIRELGVSHTFTLRLDGLARGKSYVLTPNLTRGSVQRMRIVNSTGSVRWIDVGDSYRFGAVGKSEMLRVTINGSGS